MNGARFLKSVASPRTLRRARRLMLVFAAWPIFQTTGCFPDLVGALNFELQALVNNTLINAINTVVQNILNQ